MHKHSSLRGTRPRSSGTCHLFLAEMWWVCCDVWLERGLGGWCEGVCVCVFGAERFCRILEQYISVPGFTTPRTCCTEQVHAKSTLGLSLVWKCILLLNFLQEEQGHH